MHYDYSNGIYVEGPKPEASTMCSRETTRIEKRTTKKRRIYSEDEFDEMMEEWLGDHYDEMMEYGEDY